MIAIWSSLQLRAAVCQSNDTIKRVKAEKEQKEKIFKRKRKIRKNIKEQNFLKK